MTTLRDVCIECLRKTGTFGIADGSGLPAEDIDAAKGAVISAMAMLDADASIAPNVSQYDITLDENENTVVLCTVTDAIDWATYPIILVDVVPSELANVMCKDGATANSTNEFKALSPISLQSIGTDVSENGVANTGIIGIPEVYNYTLRNGAGIITVKPMNNAKCVIRVVCNGSGNSDSLDSVVELPPLYLRWLTFYVAGNDLAAFYGLDGSRNITIAEQARQMIIRTKVKGVAPNDNIGGDSRYDLMTNSWK
jgi:hypothetical protein